MKKPTTWIITIFLLTGACPLFPQTRSLRELFPASSSEQRTAAFTARGYLYNGTRTESLTLNPQTTSNTTLTKSSLGKNPGFFVEALRLIPKNNASLINIYNALGKIQDLKGRNYYSETNKKDRPLFTESIRIEDQKKLKAFLPDPPPALSAPYRETFYVRLTDERFGHCYYEISLTTDQYGILYRISNFKNVTFGPFPVMKARTFIAFLYVEPVREGLAIYCLAGAEASDFILKYVNVSSAVTKRLDVFVSWMLDGIP